MADGVLPITAIVLAFNEEIHIGRCIERMKPFVERIVIIDSYSSDRTVEIAQSLGAEVLQNKWTTHARQFQWGLDHAGITTPWTLRLDCDEYLEPGAIGALRGLLPTLGDGVSAIDFRLKVIFKGQFIRWGGFYKTLLTRMWRTGMGAMEQRWMDERIVLAGGERIRLSGGDLVDESLKDIGWWVEKHNGYATRQMIDFVNREVGLFEADKRLEAVEAHAGKWKRFLRNGVYAKAPLYLRAVLYFLQRYILRLGFLDGRQGFVWHFMQGFWYFMLMDAKIDEARRFIADHGIEAFRDHLSDQIGFDIRMTAAK
jgi:glycosyltransferase involved in cell wall biosynthesis